MEPIFTAHTLEVSASAHAACSGAICANVAIARSSGVQPERSLPGHQKNWRGAINRHAQQYGQEDHKFVPMILRPKLKTFRRIS